MRGEPVSSVAVMQCHLSAIRQMLTVLEPS